MSHTDPEARRKYQREYYGRTRRNRKLKEKLKLLEILGGKCVKCGYDRCPAALCFHHTDPATKEFGLANTFRSFDKLLEEEKKCEILCMNCHAEHHFAPIV